MGVIGGDRHYDGPGLAKWAPWKCPSCGADNLGGLDAGCGSCGSGSAQPRHVGVVPPVDARRRVLSDEDAANRRPSAEAEEAVKAIWDRHKGEDDLHLPAPAYDPRDHERTIRPLTTEVADLLAREWLAQHPDADLMAAFLAGYHFATNTLVARTLVAPPVTADLAELAPDGKVRRTIIAALDLFKDQVLREATDEISSGEWCSIDEVDQLITQLKTEEGSL